jgi:hypothetical protein
MGPVQVLVVGFDRPRFTGDVLAQLTRLRDAGIVRLLDVLLVTRTDDGALETLEHPADLSADVGRVAAALLGEQPPTPALEPTTDADDLTTWSLADAIPLGGTAAVALIEHTWAIPLRDAIQRSGGTPLDETWLAPDDLALLGSLLDEEAHD